MKTLFYRTSKLPGSSIVNAFYNVLSSPVEANEENLSKEAYIEVNKSFFSPLTNAVLGSGVRLAN